jgi:hypothetical protein
MTLEWMAPNCGHERPGWPVLFEGQTRLAFMREALDAAGLTDAHVIHFLFLPWPSRQVEVHYHRRVVAACRYALLVEVLDVPNDPTAADPDRIEAPSRARRVLPSPSPVGDGKGPGRLTSP